MQKLFKVVVLALVIYLVADRAVLHAQGRDVAVKGCAERAAQVVVDARGKGFSDAAVTSQRDAARAQCLVSGRG